MIRLSPSAWAAIGGAALLLAVSIAYGITLNTLAGVRLWQRNIISTTSTAAHVVDGKGKPRLLDADDVPNQISEMGRALDRVEAAGERAKSAQVERNARVESAQVLAKEETLDGLKKELAAARASAADYAGRLRAQGACPADRGGSGGTAPGGAANPAGRASGAGGMSVMDEDDLRICSENTVKLRGWQTYWGKLAAIPQ